MTLIPSNEAKDFMKKMETYDKNEAKILDWTDEQYYADKKYVTNTHLGKLLHGGPQHLKNYYENGSKETSEFIFGRAAHCLLLEPDNFNSKFYAIDDTEICEEIGGTRPRTTKKYKEWVDPLRKMNAHRQELSLEDMTRVNEMINRALEHKQVREMVESANLREKVYQDNIQGVQCKIKVDAINTSNFILDYKTSKDPATLRNFGYSLKKYGYDRQGSLYSDVAKVDSFWFLVQEKTYPYTVCLAELSPDSKENGRIQYRQALNMYKLHFINNPKLIDNYLEMGSV